MAVLDSTVRVSAMQIDRTMRFIEWPQDQKVERLMIEAMGCVRIGKKVETHDLYSESGCEKELGMRMKMAGLPGEQKISAPHCQLNSKKEYGAARSMT